MSYTPSITATERYATVDVVGQRFTYPVSTSTIADVAAPIKGNNLLKASDNISDSSWTKTRASAGATVDVTLTSGEVVTLTKLVEDTSTNTHLVYQGAIPADQSKPIYVRCLAKSGERSIFAYTLYSTGYVNQADVRFNLGTASVSNTSVTGTAVIHSSSITDLGGGVYQCDACITISTTPSTSFAEVRCTLFNGGNNSYLGDGASGLSLGRFQLTEGTEATTYSQTTTERISGDGQRLTHSGDLSNAAWTKTNVTGVSAGSIAYTNAATLDTGEVLSMAGVYETTTNGNHMFTQTSDVPANAAATACVIVKGISRDYARVLLFNPSTASDYVAGVYRFSTGLVTTLTNNGTGTGAAMTAVDLGDGAVRLTMQGVPSTAAGSVRMQVYCIDDTAASSYAGEVTKGLFVADPIIVAGSAAPSYTRSYADRLAAGGSTRDRAYVLIPHVDEFDAAGDHIGTRWNTEQTWAVTDGTTTATSTESFVPPVSGDFESVGPGPYEWPPDGVTPGDDGYMHLLTGAGTFTTNVFSFAPTEASTFKSMAFNVTDGEWLGAYEGAESPVSPPASNEDSHLAVIPAIRNIIRYIV